MSVNYAVASQKVHINDFVQNSSVCDNAVDITGYISIIRRHHFHYSLSKVHVPNLQLVFLVVSHRILKVLKVSKHLEFVIYHTGWHIWLVLCCLVTERY